MFNTNTKVHSERRKCQRFEVPVGLFVVLGPLSTKLGRIIDVSRRGLSFRHVDRKAVIDSLCELDILDIEDAFCVKKVPFEIVWDFESRRSVFRFTGKRATGVEFGELTSNQMSKLEYLVTQCTRAGTEAQAFLAGVKARK